MPKISINKLSDTAIKTAKAKNKPYKLFDGRRLFLLVQPTGNRLWQVRYRFDGHERILSLGQYPGVSLKSTRGERDKAMDMILRGVDLRGNIKEQKLKRYRVKAEQERDASLAFRNVVGEWHQNSSKGTQSITPKRLCPA